MLSLIKFLIQKVFYEQILIVWLFLPFLTSLSFAQKISQDEAIPISHSLGQAIKNEANLKHKYDFDFEEIINFFDNADERKKNVTDPRYNLLLMTEKSTGKQFKGSGATLYYDGNYALILTAFHNIVDGNIELYIDSNITKGKFAKFAEMKKQTDYIKISNKDVVLIAVEVDKKFRMMFEKDKVLFNIIDLTKIIYQGETYKIIASISQYPSQATRYYSISGNIYWEQLPSVGKTVGYSIIPTLAGSSGSPIEYDYFYNCFLYWTLCTSNESKIVGVHVSSGTNVKLIPNITHSGRNIMVDNNLFELLSIEEIRALNLNGISPELSNLITKYGQESKEYDL